MQNKLYTYQLILGDDKVYYGSSTIRLPDPVKRIHRALLKDKKHTNKALQDNWNKYKRLTMVVLGYYETATEVQLAIEELRSIHVGQPYCLNKCLSFTLPTNQKRYKPVSEASKIAAAIKAGRVKHHFEHPEHGHRYVYGFQLTSEFPKMDRAIVSRLIRGLRPQAKGWTCID